ncbi:helix-turn-helix transcriptional regulator [Solirubrobacter soli]|uniref:helix-turn-helix transcriptional regulator n=1 Tax=Solirubrobacter soli TaxID=363832 RepID=UPI000426B366|nr:AAA family ATPase [Solirubrobacter soli]
MGLIEREGQLATAGGLLERATGGEGALLVIEGVAGTGKTRLLSELTGRARRQGTTVLTARGGELELDVSYGIARQLFERLLHDSGPAERERLLSGAARLAQAVVGPDAGVVFSPQTGVDHGLYWLVANLETDAPLLLVVDDVQWADAASVRFLLYLARRLEALRVLLALGLRTGEASPDPALIAHLRTEARRRVVVDALTERGSEALLRQRFNGTLGAAAISACHRVSGGNPFFLGQVAGELAATPAGDERALLERIGTLVPDEVRLSILLRLSRLGDGVREFAEALAVGGDEAPVPLLGALTGLSADGVAARLHELAQAGIAGPAGFVHPVVRTAVYQDIPLARREALHAAAGAALVDMRAPVEEVAHHLMLTTPRGDERVGATLREAGERALTRGANQSAIAMLRRALAEPPASEELAAVLSALGDASLRAGEVEEAVALLERAAGLEPAGELAVRTAVLLGSALAARGRLDEAFVALEREGTRLGGAAQLRLDAERALLANWVRDLAAPPWRDELLAGFAELEGRSPEERFALVQAALERSFITSGQAREAAAIARRAIGGGALTAEFPVDSPAGAQPAYVLVQAEELDAAERELTALLARARDRGSIAESLMAWIVLGQSALARGRLSSAAADFEAALDAALSLGDTPVGNRSVAFACSWLVEALLARGQVDEARAVIAGAEARGDYDRQELVWARAARAWVRLEVDRDPGGAAEDFLAFGEAALAGGYEERGALWRLWAARALSAAGADERAFALASEQLAISRAWGAPGGLGSAQRVVAVVAGGDEALLEEAVATLRASEYRLELARALVDLGRVLRRDGRRIDARSTLEEAMEIAARCEAAPLVAEARAELVILGARPRRAMFSGIDALTAAERRVAEMAAAGQTNRDIAQALFVTEKTVETHLHRTFRKLDIRSRRDLPRELVPH